MKFSFFKPGPKLLERRTYKCINGVLVDCDSEYYCSNCNAVLNKKKKVSKMNKCPNCKKRFDKRWGVNDRKM